MKCSTRMCPRSARLGPHCPDCATPAELAAAPDGVLRLTQGYTTVISGTLAGRWLTYGEAGEFLQSVIDATAKPKRCRKAAVPPVSVPPVAVLPKTTRRRASKEVV
jgi:hypothetical protein